MRTYAYTAYTPQGRAKRGVVIAEDMSDASKRIRDLGLLPGDIETQDQGNAAAFGNTVGLRRGRISRDMLSVFTRQMAVLLTAGLAVDEALGAIHSSAPDRQIQALSAQARAGLLEGAPLSMAMSQASRDIPAWYVAALRAAEQSGEMATVFNTLADYLDSLISDRAQIASALIYPAFVTIMAVAVCGILMVTVAPEIVGMFEASGQPLPQLTLFVLGIVETVQTRWLWIVAASGMLVALIIAMARIPAWRAQRDRAMLRLPLVGRFMRMGAAAQYLRTLALVINSRLPLPEALHHASEVL
ncbi:MAG: type II secretion system F family protein, partial [Roseinatronobacter sp.]